MCGGGGGLVVLRGTYALLLTFRPSLLTHSVRREGWFQNPFKFERVLGYPPKFERVMANPFDFEPIKNPDLHWAEPYLARSILHCVQTKPVLFPNGALPNPAKSHRGWQNSAEFERDGEGPTRTNSRRTCYCIIQSPIYRYYRNFHIVFPVFDITPFTVLYKILLLLLWLDYNFAIISPPR